MITAKPTFSILPSSYPEYKSAKTEIILDTIGLEISLAFVEKERGGHQRHAVSAGDP